MTIDEYIGQAKQRIAELDEAKLIMPIASAIHAKMLKRIFTDGKKASGSIGVYSTNPTYESKKAFKNKSPFKAVGKTGKTKFKDGQPHKSMYLPFGYKQLKDIQGYESKFVNLVYTSDLRNDFASGIMTDGPAVVVGIKRKLNQDKIQWLKEKYGSDLFALTPGEKDLFKHEAVKAANKYLFG
ncbi:MAG TPA: hypothetical protein VG603_02385 [Chitinophagales bacterium]|nr:hypothetical protein [Chitinophagales bacterium]